MEEFRLVAFRSGSAAAAAQRALREAEVPAAMMPTPRRLTESCGLSLRFSPRDAQRVRAVLDGLFSDPADCRCYAACREGGQRVFRSADLA